MCTTAQQRLNQKTNSMMRRIWRQGPWRGAPAGWASLGGMVDGDIYDDGDLEVCMFFLQVRALQRGSLDAGFEVGVGLMKTAEALELKEEGEVQN